MTSIVNIPNTVFKFFARFASLKKLDPTARALRSLETGAYAQAREEFTALLSTVGTPAEQAFLLNKRGVASVHLRELEAAAADFNAALESRPGFAPALANLGNLALERGEIEVAIALYEKAIRNDDSHAVAHLNLGVAYRRQGRLSESVRSLRKSQSLEGRSIWKPSKRA